MSGTDIAYGQPTGVFGTDLAYGQRIGRRVETKRPAGMVLCICYAISGSNLVYARWIGMVLCTCYAGSRTDRVNAARWIDMVLRSCYAISGADLVYAARWIECQNKPEYAVSSAIRYPVLTYLMAPPAYARTTQYAVLAQRRMLLA
eukprot:3941121-Rhodomonas_salina.6